MSEKNGPNIPSSWHYYIHYACVVAALVSQFYRCCCCCWFVFSFICFLNTISTFVYALHCAQVHNVFYEAQSACIRFAYNMCVCFIIRFLFSVSSSLCHFIFSCVARFRLYTRRTIEIDRVVIVTVVYTQRWAAHVYVSYSLSTSSSSSLVRLSVYFVLFLLFPDFPHFEGKSTHTPTLLVVHIGHEHTGIGSSSKTLQ